MTSAGGLVPLDDAVMRPASLLLSGPVAGVQAAAFVAEACGFRDAVSFDMGGTSTDVCLVRDGVPAPAPTLVIAGYPIRLPAVAVHTIGAGGGSIARLDSGGALVVGPESAGARPGPGLLRARRRARDRDRRRPPVGAHSRRRRVRRARPPRCRRRPSRARACRCARPRASSRWWTRRWSAPSASSPSSRASIRATSRSSRSAARGRSTRVVSPTRSGCAR